MFDIPNKDGQWVFTSPSTWQTWVKPAQYNNFIIYVCGGGGGGAGGQQASSGTLRRGGGGGASGVLQIINTPSFLLPETMYINIGAGGAGGGANTAGIIGNSSYLCYYPNINSANIIISAEPGRFGFYSNSAGGTAGVPYANQSIFSYAATNSSAGSNGGLIVAQDFSITTSCIYGGTGGGGADASNISSNGGNILASNIHPQLNGGAVNGGNGNDGYFIKKPFTILGGTGGGGNGIGAGGRGGNGIMGSGGGGGGAGSPAAAGRGGKGGDGFVIIIGY